MRSKQASCGKRQRTESARFASLPERGERSVFHAESGGAVAQARLVHEARLGDAYASILSGGDGIP